MPTLSDYEISRTADGHLTGCIHRNGRTYWLHSRYDPVQEADRFAVSQLSALHEHVDTVIVYGIGCGHHIRALATQLRPKKIKMEVWESNTHFLRELCRYPDMQDIVHNPLIEIVAMPSLTDWEERTKGWNEEGPALIIHTPSLHLIPEKLNPVRDLLESYQLFWLSVVASHRQMAENFRKNLKRGLPGIQRLVGRFSNVPIVLVAAGPSLKNNMLQLKEARKHCLIASVGTAWRPLMDAGIVPDFVMMTDPNPPMMEQIAGLEHEHVPLFALSTLYEGVLEQYQGPSYLVYQNGYIAAEQEARKRNDPLLDTGGSVATTLFSLAKVIGFSPICWVGLDLAYTNDLTHVPGAHRGIQLQQVAATTTVPDFLRKGVVATSRNLLCYLRWFERVASQTNAPLFNATEGGAFIEGFQHVSLHQFIQLVSDMDISMQRKQWEMATRS